MNSAMLLRAINRHRYMDDTSGYEMFLNDLNRESGIWKVTQSTFADWWKRRHTSSLKFIRQTSERLLIECDLEFGCLEIGNRKYTLPFTFFNNSFHDCYPCIKTTSLAKPFLAELSRHMGYGHIEISVGDNDSIGKRAAEIMSGFRERTLMEKVYLASDLDSVRGLFIEASKRSGLPDLRLWSLPSDGETPYRAAFSPRFDVDKAIINIPKIVSLQDRFGVVGTFYLRVQGLFYSKHQIERWKDTAGSNELALHGEFVNTAEAIGGDEREAAAFELATLRNLLNKDVNGVCIHGGELRSNQTPHTAAAIDANDFLYESTFYEKPYTLPIFMPCHNSNDFRKTMIIIRHQMDVSVPSGPNFAETLAARFRKDFNVAIAQGGVFVPAMHPFYFDINRYLRYPVNTARFLAFIPILLARIAKMKPGDSFANQNKH